MSTRSVCLILVVSAVLTTLAFGQIGMIRTIQMEYSILRFSKLRPITIRDRVQKITT